MNNNEKFQTPVGMIGMVLHKGGVWVPETSSLSEDAEILDQIEIKNLIVNKASVLMAQRLAPGNATNVTTGSFIADGLQYLAVGTGDAIWSLQSPPAATLTDVKLVNETARKEFTSWTFLDSSSLPVNTATNVLRLVTTFLENEAVGALVEMGLFGGDAAAAKDSGHMFNYKTFPVWNKPADARLTITWKITF